MRPLYPDHLSIFVALSHWEMYEQRMRMRGSETAESMTRRLETSCRELEQQTLYQHVIFNDDLETAVARFRELLAEYEASRR